MNEKILSICIPVFNKFNFTKSCLKDLEKLPNDHEIIVVDNGSTDETQSNLSNSKEIIYIRNESNGGFARASNIAYAKSSSPNVLFLNNDIRVSNNHSNWTQPLIDRCSEGLVGPTMGLLDKDLNFIKEANRVLVGNSYMSGWCLASSKEIFNKLIINGYTGPFSEEFGVAYFEDTDLSFRARKLGIKFNVVNLPVVHFGKQSSSQLNVHQLYTKARQIFIKKWK
jgi:GT2 family glycosyltransferase